MNVLCAVGWHVWRAYGGEVLRDKRGKIRITWQVCARNCGAMRSRSKSDIPAAVV